MDPLSTENAACSDWDKLLAAVSSAGSVELTHTYEKQVFGAIMYITVSGIVHQCECNNAYLSLQQKTMSPMAARILDSKLNTQQKNKKPSLA